MALHDDHYETRYCDICGREKIRIRRATRTTYVCAHSTDQMHRDERARRRFAEQTARIEAIINTPKLTWTQVSDTEWIGRADGLTYPRVIEYDAQFGQYTVEGTKGSYKSLTAAKIAAARTAASYEAEIS
jgi:hypothetical protein